MYDTLFKDAEILSAYSRTQALSDGTLVDVTEWASGETGFIGGFRVPVAFTGAVWAAVNHIPAELAGFEDVRGRAHDVLFMASLAARRNPAAARITFQVILHEPGEADKVTLVCACGPGDDLEPVITIGFPSDF
jgi:hypothetical protein